ncbi:RBR-type E3 ubiquitin transferase [Entamoeba marina]
MQFTPLNFDKVLTVGKDQQKKMIRDHIKLFRKLTAPRVDPVLECDICYDEMDISFCYRNPICGHSYCLPCIREYVTDQINKANTIVKCPNANCSQVIPFNDLVNCGIINNQQTYDKYLNTLTRLHLETDPDVRYCEKCGNVMIGEKGITMMRCSKCKYAFCFKCKEPWHADFTCEEYKQWKLDHAKGDNAYADFLRNHTKPCPKCKKPIEKSGGCNHMTCACGYHFCWVCLKEYKPGHFILNSCKQFS